MFSVKKNTTIKKYQKFVEEVYGLPNDRFFSPWDMLTNIERFATRSLKGIRKIDKQKTKINLLISLSFFMSMMNQFHIEIEEETWKRFPFLCSYCAACPCCCKEKKIKRRKKIFGNEKKRPRTLEDFQNMFRKIYSPETRTLEHAGIHLAEELGEFAEAILVWRGERKKEDFDKIPPEAADLFSCYLGVFNSSDINLAEELAQIFSHNCHICHNAPCTCSFKTIAEFNS